MIPKIIHYCWYGNNKPDELMQKCMASWQRVLPEFTVQRWDESNTPFDEYPFLKELYKNGQWAFIADFTRLYALQKVGGVYFDTDIQVLKSFENLLNEEVFLGFQYPYLNKRHPVNNAVLGAVSNHPFLHTCLLEVEKVQKFKLHAIGGPPVVSTVLRKQYGLKHYGDQRLNGVRVLPSDYFYPFAWNEEYHSDCITENTLCIHWWNYSWSSRDKDWRYYINEVLKRLKRIPFVVSNRWHSARVKKN